MPDPLKEKEKRKRRPENGTIIGVVIAGFIALLTIVMVLARGRQQIIPLDGTATAIQLTNVEIARLLTETANAPMTFVAQTQQAALATESAIAYQTNVASTADAAMMTSTISLFATFIYAENPDRTSAAATVAAMGDLMATYNAGHFTFGSLRAPTLTPSPSLSPTITPTSRVLAYPDCPMYMNTRWDYSTERLIEQMLSSEAFDLPFAPNGVEATAYGEDYHCGDPVLTPTPIFVPLVPSFSIELRLTEAEINDDHYKGMAIRDILWALRDAPLENADTMTVIFQHENGRRIEWKLAYTDARKAVDDGLLGEELYNAGELTIIPAPASVLPSPTYTSSPANPPTPTSTRRPTATPTATLMLRDELAVSATAAQWAYGECSSFDSHSSNRNRQQSIEAALAPLNLPLAPVESVTLNFYGVYYPCGLQLLTPTPIFIPLANDIRINLVLSAGQIADEDLKGDLIGQILRAIEPVSIQNPNYISIIFQSDSGQSVWTMAYNEAYQLLHTEPTSAALFQAGASLSNP